MRGHNEQLWRQRRKRLKRQRRMGRCNRRDDNVTTVAPTTPERLELEERRLRQQWQEAVGNSLKPAAYDTHGSLGSISKAIQYAEEMERRDRGTTNQ